MFVKGDKTLSLSSLETCARNVQICANVNLRLILFLKSTKIELTQVLSNELLSEGGMKKETLVRNYIRVAIKCIHTRLR